MPKVSREMLSQISAVEEDRAARWLEEMEAGTYELPPVWTAEHVERRMIEAAEIELREPRGMLGPKPPGCNGVRYIHDAEDKKGHEVERDRPKFPSSSEIKRMREAFDWVAEFLADNAEHGTCVLNSARWTALEAEVDEEADRAFYGRAEMFRARCREGHARIAARLNDLRRPVS